MPCSWASVDEVAEVLARSEVWVDVEEVLDAVTVVARRLECDLAKDRAHPERGDAETLEIAELALQSLQGAALPYAAGLEPSVIVDASGVVYRVERRPARSHRAAVVVPVAAALVPIREPVDEQEIKHLVFPSSGRRRVLASGQLGEVEIQQAFFDLLGHVGFASLN